MSQPENRFEQFRLADSEFKEVTREIHEGISVKLELIHRLFEKVRKAPTLEIPVGKILHPQLRELKALRKHIDQIKIMDFRNTEVLVNEETDEQHQSDPNNGLEVYQETVVQTFEGDDTYICTYCKKEYNDALELDTHKNNEHQNYQVEVQRLMRDMVTFEQLDHNKKHSCNQCNMIFTSLVAYRQHLDRSHKVKNIFQCPVCYQQFIQATPLANHIRDHSEGLRWIYLCPYTQRNFKCTRALARHITATPQYGTIRYGDNKEVNATVEQQTRE